MEKRFLFFFGKMLFTGKWLPLKAFFFALWFHRTQKRDSGHPYIVHPISVAMILFFELNIRDWNLIAAAFLHDVIEDTSASMCILKKAFPDDIIELVHVVSKSVEQETECLIKKHQFRRQYVQTIALHFFGRAILLKLADILANLRTLDACSLEKKIRVKEKVLFYFLWLAEYLAQNFPDEKKRAEYLKKEILSEIRRF
ncbi:MAG: HD domain-containing protein [Candidatus Moranbacteria bacterium]|nr:HD domain-containing protein [Candidatus Moranbacteria bacterium]